MCHDDWLVNQGMRTKTIRLWWCHDDWLLNQRMITKDLHLWWCHDWLPNQGMRTKRLLSAMQASDGREFNPSTTRGTSPQTVRAHWSAIPNINNDRFSLHISTPPVRIHTF
jgi:hypothetical protein